MIHGVHLMNGKNKNWWQGITLTRYHFTQCELTLMEIIEGFGA